MPERDEAGWTRWSRQMAIPGFGTEAQKRLVQSRVAVLGVGGVGGAAALYLAAAGAGSLLIVDRDVVELTNLNRQVLFTSADLGRPKALVGAERLRALDPDLDVKAVVKDAKEDDLRSVIKGSDFVLNCFDRNADRLAANRVCIDLGVPAAYGFAQDFSGEVFTVVPQESACLACALDETFPEPEVTPVVGVATGVIGVAMAAAALRFLTGIGEVAEGQRLIYDLAFSELIRIPVSRNPRCPVCGR